MESTGNVLRDSGENSNTYFSKKMKISTYIVLKFNFYLSRAFMQKISFNYFIRIDPRIFSAWQWRKIEFVIASSLILFVLQNCSEQQKIQEKKRETIPITLKFSTDHQSYFMDVNKSTYLGTEINEIFEKLREKSDTVCEMVWGQRKMNQDILYEFISQTSFSKEPFKTWSHPLPKLIAGCWNFIKLNDTRPDLDFHLVNFYYPEEEKECFSVGFLQPYWMHTILKCKKLTMLDIDWKIHDAHNQFLNFFNQKKMSTEASITESVSNLNLGWIARFDNKQMLKKENTTFDSICFSKFKKNCINFLLKFQEDYTNLSEIEFQVSALHNASYKFLPGTVPVLFFSNAIENLYTSKPQFEQIITSVYEGLGDGRKAIFIHHAAGQSQFGIYELLASKEGYQLKTVCKDNYISSPVGETHPYETHFDKLSESKGSILKCSSQPFLKKYL
jgi:hypothetical protein